MTVLYSAAAFTASAVMDATIGVDPLKVVGNEGPVLVSRLIGSSIIGMSLSGGIDMLQEHNKPEALATAETTQKSRQPLGKTPSLNLGMNHVMTPPTPNNRDNQRTRA